MIEALQFEFMQNALAAGLLASIICGIMGTFVVVNRIVFLSGGIAHASYGGIGMAIFLGWPILFGTIGFAVLAAMIMAMVTLKAKHRADTIIGVVWAVGMAIGIIFVDLTSGYNVDLMSYLFGSILSVPRSDLWIMLVMCFIIIGFNAVYYKEILALSYDEEFAQIRGIPVRILYFFLVGMLAVTIVMVIRIVGLILVIALLTIPPFIIEKYSQSLSRMMVGASLLGICFTLCGLWLSYIFNLTSGAAIILVAGTSFFVFLLLERFIHRFRAEQPD